MKSTIEYDWNYKRVHKNVVITDAYLEKAVKQYVIIHGMSIRKVVRMALQSFLERQADILALAAMEILTETSDMEEAPRLPFPAEYTFQERQ